MAAKSRAHSFGMPGRQKCVQSPYATCASPASAVLAHTRNIDTLAASTIGSAARFHL